jgi:hypothetical protein
VGITGQAQFIQKANFVALAGIDPPPRAVWTYGWEAGIEFSYHFAKYFGVSIGINYGTVFSYDSDAYISKMPDIFDGWREVNDYERSPMRMHGKEIQFPIKLEFHYPLRKDLFFTAEAGVKIKGLDNWLTYKESGLWLGTYDRGYYYSTIDDYDPERDVWSTMLYYQDYGRRDMSKIYCELFLGMGLYYKLPYGDLLRFTTGVNMAFKNTIEGVYLYYLTESYGAFSVKNDFIYMQLSYIHTFNFLKAKRYLKKNEYSFSSKKERRKKIFDLLGNW